VVHVRLQPVASSSIRAIGYDQDASELWIAYHSAADPYVYLEVPAEVFAELEEAGSKGNYVNRMIKPFYRYERRAWPSGRRTVVLRVETVELGALDQ
jgi:hypothetical protein